MSAAAPWLHEHGVAKGAHGFAVGPVLSRRHLVLAGAAGASALLLGLPTGRPDVPLPSIGALIDTDPDFSIWRHYVDAAELGQLFRETEDITVFAPRDDVFARNDQEVARLDAIAGLHAETRRRRLRHFVLSHALAGTYPLSSLGVLVRDAKTLDGGSMHFSAYGDANLTVEWDDTLFSVGTTITEAPRAARNGLVYPLGSVVLL